jgi:3-hydroxyacyl-[acyl-carrier-protein] dehydratase
VLLNNLYKIESFTGSENQILCSVKLDAEHEIFRGHFPGQPVLPGVCMMEMITELAGRFLNKSFRISESSMVKFLNMIDPGKNPIIQLEINYVDAERKLTSNGRIFFESLVFMKFQMILYCTADSITGS